MKLIFGGCFLDELAEDGEVVPPRPQGVPQPTWKDLKEQKSKPDAFASTSTNSPQPSKQSKSGEKKRLHWEENLCEKIKLEDGRTVTSYDDLWGQILPQGLGPRILECFQVGEETVITDIRPEPALLQARPKTKAMS